VTSLSRESEVLATEREILEKWIPLDPNRPVYTAIRTVFVEKFAQFYLLVCETTAVEGSQVRGPVSRERASKAAFTLKSLDKECTQLAGLLFNRLNLWATQDWRKPPILKFLLRTIQRTSGGRPATKQQVAVQAKEMRLADPKRWTWPKITAALCDCGQQHTIHCQDNLRREVLHLEKLLRKCGVPSLTWDKPADVSPMR
jgi:hypothetical protein